jgi:DUF3048 family protein
MARRRHCTVLAGLAVLVACGGSPQPNSGSSNASPGNALIPALVQVENISAARPQWGLQQASTVYEYVTEGGITRFSVLYTSAPNSRVGPVRSARLVTIRLARIYGALVVYSGASTAVQHALDASMLPHVDEKASAGDLFRIGDRQVPHNLVTDGDHLSDLMRRYASSGHSGAASSASWPRTTAAPASAGTPVTRFTVPFSDQERPVFTWDAAAKAWSRQEAGTGSFVDAQTHAPVEAATVVVQQVSIEQTADVEDVNGAHGVDLVLSGSGAAQVFTAGREYDASWSQPEAGPPSLTLQGGGAAPVSPGLVWVCLVATGSPAVAG